MLYGLDQPPKQGCRVLLVDDEAACHVLWHHGFDAIATQGEAGYVVKRDCGKSHELQVGRHHYTECRAASLTGFEPAASLANVSELLQPIAACAIVFVPEPAIAVIPVGTPWVRSANKPAKS
jgi:hypothetical protein